MSEGETETETGPSHQPCNHGARILVPCALLVLGAVMWLDGRESNTWAHYPLMIGGGVVFVLFALLLYGSLAEWIESE